MSCIPIYGVEQATDEWLDLRKGVLTASNFHRILTPKTLKPSAQQDDYIDELAAEVVMGRPEFSFASGDMMNGLITEPEALRMWSFETGKEIDRPAFVYLDERKTIGCSPDAIGVEVKCPKPATQVKRLRAKVLPAEYICQVQGHMYVLGLDEMDFYSYCPGLPSFLFPVERDPVFIARLSEELESCAERLAETIEMLRVWDTPLG